MPRNEIAIGKTDVLLMLEWIDACSEAVEKIESLPEHATAEDAWSAVEPDERYWFLYEVFRVNGGCFYPRCDLPCGANTKRIVARWPIERVIKALVSP